MVRGQLREMLDSYQTDLQKSQKLKRTVLSLPIFPWPGFGRTEGSVEFPESVNPGRHVTSMAEDEIRLPAPYDVGDVKLVKPILSYEPRDSLKNLVKQYGRALSAVRC